MDSSVSKEKDRELITYYALHKVFVDGAFSSIVLNDALKENRTEAPSITKLFYGVLDKSIQFDYLIDNAVAKRPKTSVRILLKMGLYMMRYMSVPDYAAVDKIVSLCKTVGKAGIAGFVNAFLRKNSELSLPSREEVDENTYLSVIYSYPKWAIEKLVEEYGSGFVEEFLSADINLYTHIRANITKIDNTEFDKKMQAIGYENKSKYGYYVTHNQLQQLKKSDYIIQSFPSMAAIYALIDGLTIDNALDLCAAPGGKAILIKQLTGALVTACDILPHRVKLINKYASSVGISDIKIAVNDAKNFLFEWVDFFDFVLCDVPCSNFGVVGSKPDIVINKNEHDTEGLKKSQYDILNTAAHYVKPNGILAYSTCTVFKDENESIAEKFLSEHKNFILEPITGEFADGNGFLKILPQKDHCGAFFAVRFRRIS